jgi:hypothetical protein
MEEVLEEETFQRLVHMPIKVGHIINTPIPHHLL